MEPSLELIPIRKSMDENTEFISNPLTTETLAMTIDFFNRIGYEPPWIGYYAKLGGSLVGSCAFKGKPKNGKVEIAYGTFESFRSKGIGKMMCKALVELSLATDPSVKITARTLTTENHSTRILRSNNFAFAGVVHDDEDGDVWEWEYIKS
jgi:ribosomal-protein-alanine N-acetyltransferase